MEYKYINQETIDSGGKNITSPEMFAEARVYNMEAAKNYSRLQRVHRIFNIWMVVQFFVLIYKVWIIMMSTQASDLADKTGTPWWRIGLCAVCFVAYVALIIYFVYVKGSHERFVLLLISLPVMSFGWFMMTLPAMNFILGWYYTKVHDELSKELGYPSFTRLNVTTVNTDAENLSQLTYDSIREKINRDHPHDGTFL